MTASLADALVASDRLYFGLNWQTRRIGPFQLSWITGYEALPAGAVGHQIDPVGAGAGGDELSDQLDRVEQSFARWCNPVVRLYLRDCPEMRQALLRRGYGSREEVGFVRTEPAQPADPGIELLAVDSDSHWQEKLALQSGSDQAVDGHACRPEDWVGLERTRSKSGQLRFHLILRDGQVHGTFGLMQLGPLLRVKNLYLRPASRGCGIGTAALHALYQRIDGNTIQAVGLVALRGKDGEHFYRACRMREVCTLTEWTLRLK